VTSFEAIEWLLFVDDALIESRLYHGARAAQYVTELAEVIEDLKDDDWQESEATPPQG